MIPRAIRRHESRHDTRSPLIWHLRERWTHSGPAQDLMDVSAQVTAWLRTLVARASHGQLGPRVLSDACLISCGR